jgi:zinc transport system substrate-binding protein
MRKIFIIVFAAALAVSCNIKTQSSEKPVVTVTIPPQKFFVEKIAGDAVSVNVMVPPGASPEEYEPSPRQVQELTKSIIYFYVGHLGFEKPWMSRFNNTAPDVDFVSCSKGIDLLVSSHDHNCSEDDHSHNHGTDPHIWTSPENVKTMSRTIAGKLKKHFPENAEIFEKNLNSFINEIDTLDNFIRSQLNDTTDIAFMIFHPSLGYFARDYHLEQLSIEFEGKSPSTAHVKNMVDISREKKINTVFVQSQFETSKAKVIADEIGARVEMVDPLQENWLEEMYSITEKIRKSVGQ